MDFHRFIFISLLYFFIRTTAEPINYKPQDYLLKILLSAQERLSQPEMNPSTRFNVLRNLGDWYQKSPQYFNNDVEPIKSEIMEEIEELDQVEEQANADLVAGINLMADRNETLDQVIDNVLETNNKL